MTQNAAFPGSVPQLTRFGLSASGTALAGSRSLS